MPENSCKALLKGMRAVNHSEECRRRMEKQLEGTERSEKAREREYKFYEEVMGREDRKRKAEAEERANGESETKEPQVPMEEDHRPRQRPHPASDRPSSLGMDEEERR